MPFVWILNGRKIKRVLFIFVTAFFAALIAFVQHQQIAVFSASAQPQAISSVQTSKSQVALTFDLSWGDVQIEPILKVLKENHTKATFFISGEWADRHQDLIKELKTDGFEIESHGMTHDTSYTTLKPNEIKRDLSLANESLTKAGADTPKFVRPPLGAVNETTVQSAAEMNQQVIMWNIDPQDYTNPGYKAIVESVMNNAKKGSIIRLHASDSARQTDRALPLIIKGLEEKGYSLVTLSTLISDSKSTSNVIN
ncbi:polysaccharide deacetylase family protein [Pullulanibacillus sp. KACC 23026]|uniref:polysaccharide deacetylase family protein n=1 Tax=Pullulanibacillus sp. KACC 23026 TaxID=3028315 RepID=UPI0023B0979D|nr:polysaccharide deacetylase family protein [Pullulanibacillus sp. KACC 23026]WEG12621.1 polysaccharide deacetylase family protein [Pullulanibacillus sp. KACC 23026]